MLKLDVGFGVKTRQRALLVMLLMILAGCGGSGSGGSDKKEPQGDTVDTVSDPDEPSVPERALKDNEAFTEQGVVSGVWEEEVLTFRGIPYAAPPVGERRFSPPQAAVIRDNLLLATEFGPDCPQKSSPFSTKGLEEDCLFLNVYTPTTDGDYPVMVWIYGGGYLTGSGGDSYDPKRLVKQGVIVVTLNYRLGALGFLAHPALSVEMGQGSGNFGLMDQQMALRWLQQNITHFGGDPGNVTIMGESAGGHSVLSHLVSPEAAGLFHRAIVQSGSYGPSQMSLAQAEQEGQLYAEKTGCGSDVLACLREKSVEELLDQQNSDFYLPTTDTALLPLSIKAALDQGRVNGVPVLSGTNLHESRLFVAIQDKVTPLIDEGVYRVSANVFLRKDARTLDARKVSERYLRREQIVNPHKYRFALSAMRTDWEFACHGLDQVQRLSQVVPTYMYEFADIQAPSAIPENWTFPLGAAHASEIPYIMNSEQVMINRGAEQAQIDLSETMLRYWAAFARNGNPGDGDGTATLWPSVGDTGQVMTLTPPQVNLQTTAQFSQTHSCEYWKQPDLLP